MSLQLVGCCNECNTKGVNQCNACFHEYIEYDDASVKQKAYLTYIGLPDVTPSVTALLVKLGQ